MPASRCMCVIDIFFSWHLVESPGRYLIVLVWREEMYRITIIYTGVILEEKKNKSSPPPKQ